MENQKTKSERSEVNLNGMIETLNVELETLRDTDSSPDSYTTVLQDQISDLKVQLQVAIDEFNSLENDHQEC